MVTVKNKEPQYKDRSRYPNITDGYEGELKDEYDKMLVEMSKDIADKLKEIIK